MIHNNKILVLGASGMLGNAVFRLFSQTDGYNVTGAVRSRQAIGLLPENVRNLVVSGLDVKISGFGNFILRDKNERPGRNPKTGEDVTISPRRVVTFRAGQKLKSRVENNAFSE